MKIFKVISIPFFAIFGIFCFLFLQVMLRPDLEFGDFNSVLRELAILFGGAFFGALFWLMGTLCEKRFITFKRMLIFITIVYAICLFAILFGSVDTTRQFAGIRSYSLIPFKTTIEYYQAYKHHLVNSEVIYFNIFGNLLLFCPAGFIVPYFIKKARKLPVFCLLLLGFLCLVEFMQFLTARGSMDIDDVILNFAGALAVFLITWNKAVQNWMIRNYLLAEN